MTAAKNLIMNLCGKHIRVVENREISSTQDWQKMGQNVKYLFTPILKYRHQEVNFDFSSKSICLPKVMIVAILELYF